MAAATLEVSGLVTELAAEQGPLRAVDGVSFSLQPGEALALVGESGCGKTLTALSLMQLLPPAARLLGGSIKLGGEELVGAGPARLRALRGHRLAMIFQEPLGALNPVFTVGEQIAEALTLHLGMDAAQAQQHAVQLLADEGLDAPERQARQFPHQLSGGMRQRVLIAMALACSPQLLIADEPTSALDARLQERLMVRLAALRTARGMALLWVTHDLALAARHADAVAVMYAGRIVERGPVALLQRPQHPYTAGLLQCAVRGAVRDGDGRRRVLPTIEGHVPGPDAWRDGCAFRDRCPRASARCSQRVPAMADGLRAVACHHPLDGGDRTQVHA